MVQSHFALSWESYRSSICSGFTSLQQNSELVDMTIAADGHYVKVHQVLMALVSPYLKELITSAPCQHPVIFLNNVSHQTLTALLEYIYTGEVLVQSENLTSFVNTAKSLRIRGLEDFQQPTNPLEIETNVSQTEDNKTRLDQEKKLRLVPSSAYGQVKVEVSPATRKIMVKPEVFPNPEQNRHDTHDYDDDMDDTMHDDHDTAISATTIQKPSYTVKDASGFKDSASKLQYTMSIRGALQIILNRFIYNLFSTKNRNGERRWRCVDYRTNRCPAFVTTRGNIVLNRANLHNHHFHDRKILQKIEKKAVFSELEEVEIYKDKMNAEEKEDEEAMEGYEALDLDDSMTEVSKTQRGLEPIE